MLGELLQVLFNNVDDALFEMADRSRSDADQSMYFESMREIRLHRKRVLTDFVQAFNAGFEAAFVVPGYYSRHFRRMIDFDMVWFRP